MNHYAKQWKACININQLSCGKSGEKRELTKTGDDLISRESADVSK